MSLCYGEHPPHSKHHRGNNLFPNLHVSDCLRIRFTSSGSESGDIKLKPVPNKVAISHFDFAAVFRSPRFSDVDEPVNGN